MHEESPWLRLPSRSGIDEEPPAAPIMGWPGIGVRLGVEVALTPWPVVLWIQAQGPYFWSIRHGNADALFAVGSEALIASTVTALVGLVLVLICGRGLGQKLIYTGWVALIWFVLTQYIAANATASV